MGINEEKASLRTRYRRERKERYLPHSFLYLAEISEIKNAQVIASYISYGDEPDTSELNQALIAAGKVLLLPRVNGDQMEWVQWNGDESQLQSTKKMKEPLGDVFTNSASLEVIIVPALRVDRHGIRLGQGGGYYDRTLATSQSWTVALVHPDEISGTDLPREQWDIPVKAVATPDLITRF